MKQNEKLNLMSFSLAKGIAILSVVCFHTYDRYESEFLTVAKYFLVLSIAVLPAFFLISGCGFKEATPRKMLKKTFSGLVVPYLWVMATFATIFPVVRFCIEGSLPVAIDQTKRFLIAFILGYARYGKMLFGVELFWCTPVWFLLASFVASNVLNLILQIRNEKVRLLGVVLAVLLGNYLFSVEFFYGCIPQGLRAVGYFYVGYMLKKNELILRLWKKPIVYVILIPCFLLDLKLATLPDTVFINVLVEFIFSTFAGMLFLCAAIYLSTFELKGLDWINKVGIYSHWILCLHSAEMDIVPWHYLPKVFAQHQFLGFVVEMILKAIIYIAGCMILKRMAKIRYKRKVNLYAR